MSARQIASHAGLGLKRPLLRPAPRLKPQPPVVPLVQEGISIKQASRAYFQKLGAYIGVLRKAHGMTQAELARAIGVSQQTMFAYEIGERRVSILVLARIAVKFAMSLEQLAGMPPISIPKGRLSPRAFRHAERIQALSKTAQRFLIRILDVLELQAKANKQGERDD